MKARLLVPLLAALAGCSSAPSHFYFLDAEPGAPAAVRSASVTVALGAVNLPGALDRPQIARRHGANELDYAENERWAAPLDEMVRRTLASDLAGRLPPGMVLIAGGLSPPASRTIALDVSRFDADAGGTVTLAARWQILGIGGARGAVAHAATIVEPGSDAAAAAIAAAMSHAVAALASDIAGSLR